MSNYAPNVFVRFWSKVDKNGQPPALAPDLGPCWIWRGALTHGYGQFYLDGRVERAHRVAYKLAVGPIPLSAAVTSTHGVCILHRCDVRACVNPSHLYAGDHLANMRDMMERGRHVSTPCYGNRNGSRRHPERLARGDRAAARKRPERVPRGDGHYARRTPDRLPRGEDNGMAKLTDESVRAIRRERSAGARLEELAIAFQISQSQVSVICRRLSWCHVEDEP